MLDYTKFGKMLTGQKDFLIRLLSVVTSKCLGWSRQCIMSSIFEPQSIEASKSFIILNCY